MTVSCTENLHAQAGNARPALGRTSLEVYPNRLPKPSYVVPFWVVYYIPLPKTIKKPKKELHWSPWVGFREDGAVVESLSH